MGRGPAAVIVDGSGNQLTIVDDSGTYRLALPLGAATETTLTTLATETKLEAVRVLLASLDGKDYATQTTLASLLSAFTSEDFASETTLNSLLTAFNAEDFASETTLAAFKTAFDSRDLATETTLDAVRDNIGEAVASPAANTLLARFQSLLDRFGDAVASPVADTLLARVQEIIDVNTSIKDTDGVKKITDQLPAGTNEIGLVAQGTKAVTSGAWPTVLVDSVGNYIGQLVDNSLRRLLTQSTVTGQVGGAGSEIKVTVIQDAEDANEKRLQTESRLAPGSTVNIGNAIPSDPSDLVLTFLSDGSSHDMLVDGSSTPVAFTFGPSASEIWSLQEMLIVFTADDFEFNGASFGPNTLLTNGIVVELVQNSVVTELFNIKQNEDFLRTPGRLPLVNNTGQKDVLSSTFAFGGLVKLDASTSDIIRVRVRDNLTSVKLKYLTATGYATKV